MKNFLILFFFFIHFAFPGFSQASNQFDIGLEQLSSQIKIGLDSKYNFKEFKDFLIEFINLDQSNDETFFLKFKSFGLNNEAHDFFIFQLYFLINQEMKYFIEQNFSEFRSSFLTANKIQFLAINDPIIIEDLMNHFFIKSWLKILFKTLVKKTRIMIEQVDENFLLCIVDDNHFDEIIDVEKFKHLSSLPFINDKENEFELQDLPLLELQVSSELKDLGNEDLIFPALSHENKENCVEKKNAKILKGNCKKNKLKNSIKNNLQCPYCFKKYSSTGNLNKHIKIHTDASAFECSICDKKYFSEYAFTEHLRLHSGEKPIKCLMCDKKFATSKEKAKHKSSEHP